MKLLFGKDKELYVFCRNMLGYIPRDIEVYRLAFVHRSKAWKNADGVWLSNERLEYLGDAVLGTIVADFLYREYPRKREGFLTSTRSKIVKRESLNRIGIKLGLDKVMMASVRSMSHNSYIYGNAVEALVGAVFIDRGFERCRKFVEQRIIHEFFNMNKLVHTESNFKSRLIEWTQKNRVEIEYRLIGESVDADNSPMFSIELLLGGLSVATATGYSKKEAHQSASREVLARLRKDENFKTMILGTASASVELPSPDEVAVGCDGTA